MAEAEPLRKQRSPVHPDHPKRDAQYFHLLGKTCVLEDLEAILAGKAWHRLHETTDGDRPGTSDPAAVPS